MTGARDDGRKTKDRHKKPGTMAGFFSGSMVPESLAVQEAPELP
jgi:hypothetical protein